MAPFNSYEDLKATVEERRKDVLTLEIDMGAAYSPEHEAAKTELQQAKAMRSLTGGQGFLGDNLDALEERVRETKPESNSVWVRYRRLDLNQWAELVGKGGLSPVQQYEKVLPETFIGVWGVDPSAAEEAGEATPEPLSTNGALLSSKGVDGILPGGGLHSVVQNFMAWQNSGGDVTIRPPKSGRA